MSGEPRLPADHYRLSIVPLLPEKSDLRHAFMAISSVFFSGQAWNVPEAWQVSAGAPGERVFFVRGFCSDERDPAKVRAWALAHDYRPATHLEMIGFGRVFPEAVHAKDTFVNLGSLVALGSTMESEGVYANNAVLESYRGGPLTLSTVRDREYAPAVDEIRRFLFVRLGA